MTVNPGSCCTSFYFFFIVCILEKTGKVVKDESFVGAVTNGFLPVMRLDSEDHFPPVDFDDFAAGSDFKAQGCGAQMADVDQAAYAELTLLQIRLETAAAGVFKEGDQGRCGKDVHAWIAIGIGCISS